jgi:hypothetical protein
MVYYQGPHDVAIAADDRMGAAKLVCFVGIQSGVNPAKDDGRAAVSRRDTYRISAQRIARVDSNPHDVTRVYGVDIEWLQRFINDARSPIRRRCRRAEDEQPSGCDDANTKGQMTGIYKMDGHHTPDSTEDTVA